VNRLMKEIGPLADIAPAFPTAGGALAPLRAVTEKAGRSDFSNMWSGQSAALARVMTTRELTRYLAGV
jgi:nitronate monooxygenase